MKRLISVLLTATIFVLLVSCQSTPDQPVVLQKDFEQMIEKGLEDSGETASPAAVVATDYSSLCEYYGVPKRFQTSINKGKLTINCDVQIELPDTTQLPMARVESGCFSQEQVYAFWNALVGDTPMYVYPEQVDKEYYQQKILEAKAELAAETNEAMKQGLQDRIDRMEKEYQNAPEHVELVSADGTLQTKEMREFNIKESLGEYTTLFAISAPYENGAMSFSVFNDVEDATGIYSGTDEQGNTFTLAPSSTATLSFKREGEEMNFSYYWQGRILSDVTEASLSGVAAADCELTTTPKQAREKTENFLKDMGLDDMAIDTVSLCSNHEKEYLAVAEGGYSSSSGPVSDEPERQAYVFRILRKQGGVRVESTHEMSQTTLEVAQGDEEVAVGKSWSYENMIVAVDDEGIVNVHWQGPLEVTQVLTENTAIKTWSEIQNVFEKMIVIKNAAYEETNMYTSVTIDITNVSLSLQRVMERDSYTTGVLVPVWNFYGTMTCEQTEGEPLLLQCGYTPFISINAIDGSVIDISKGY